MTRTPNEYVGRALDSLRACLAPFVESEVRHYASALDPSRLERFIDKPVSGLDTGALLSLMESVWSDVFQNTLGRLDRSLVVELRQYRNFWAHQETFSLRDADRALDSCERLLRSVGANARADAVARDRRAMSIQSNPNQDDLFATVKADDITRINILIDAGVDVNAAERATGYTPLMWAESAAATNALIEAGADVGARDRQGHTPLMWLMSKHNVPIGAAEVAKVLIDAGADLRATDSSGKTALDWARTHRDQLRQPRERTVAEQVVAILQNQGHPEGRPDDRARRHPSDDIIEAIQATVHAGTVIPKPAAKAAFKVKGWGRRRGEDSLIYYVPNHSVPTAPYEKGVTKSEWTKAFERLKYAGEFTSAWFEINMRPCANEGHCNFTTIGGIFQLLGIAVYSGPGVYRSP